MVPDCLKNLIGIKCLPGSDAPTSSYFINDLEGMSLKYAANITPEMLSGLVFLRDKIAFATGLVLSEISAYLMPYFRLNSIVDEFKAGEFSSTNLAPVGSPLLRGLKIKVRGSRLLRVGLSRVRIQMSNALATGNLVIVDGPETTSYPFTTDANGVADFDLPFVSNTHEILVAIDNDTFGMNNTAIKDGCNCSTKIGTYLIGTGYNGSGISSSTYGIQVYSTAVCSVDELSCILGNKLALPVLYRSGLEIVKEAKTTDRLNSITILGDDKAQFLFEEFSSQYDKQMKILIQGIPNLMARIDDCCVSCRQSRYVQGRP